MSALRCLSETSLCDGACLSRAALEAVDLNSTTAPVFSTMVNAAVNASMLNMDLATAISMAEVRVNIQCQTAHFLLVIDQIEFLLSSAIAEIIKLGCI